MLCTYMNITVKIRHVLICSSVALKSNRKKHFCFPTGDSVKISHECLVSAASASRAQTSCSRVVWETLSALACTQQPIRDLIVNNR